MAKALSDFNHRLKHMNPLVVGLLFPSGVLVGLVLGCLLNRKPNEESKEGPQASPSSCHKISDFRRAVDQAWGITRYSCERNAVRMRPIFTVAEASE